MVRKVLEHLGLPTESPSRASARAPPEQLDLGPSVDTLATDETWPVGLTASDAPVRPRTASNQVDSDCRGFYLRGNGWNGR